MIFRNIGVQTGVCTARGFAQFCANSAQVVLDVVSVRILTRDFLRNLRSVSRDLDGRFPRELLFTFPRAKLSSEISASSYFRFSENF